MPNEAPVARPCGDTRATAGASEVHVAAVVRFWVLPSEKVPVRGELLGSSDGEAGAAGADGD